MAHITNAFTISKNFSVGVQSSYLFGQLDETETLSDQISDSAIVTNRNVYLGNLYFKFGAQYKGKLNKNLGIAIGATASNQTKLRADYSVLAKSGNTILIDNKYYKGSYFSLPVTYTAGIAAILKDAYTVAFDYNFQGWRDLKYAGISYTLDNSQRYSLGFEYSKKANYMNIAYEKYFLQGGIFYNDSYLRINGTQLKDYGLTIGAGTEISRTQLTGLAVSAALEVGQRGTTDKGLIKENYTQFNLTVSYRDFWFSRKMKKYD
jgi:hypothetical protein